MGGATRKKLHAGMNQKTATQSAGSEVAEAFRLPDSFGQDGWGAGDGYAVWEHIVRRRTQATPKTRRVVTSRLRSGDSECNRGDDPHKHGCAPTGRTHCAWQVPCHTAGQKSQKRSLTSPQACTPYKTHKNGRFGQRRFEHCRATGRCSPHGTPHKYLDDRRADLHYAMDGGDGTRLVLTGIGILTVARMPATYCTIFRMSTKNDSAVQVTSE